MDFFDALDMRRSIREFKDEVVPSATLKKLLGAVNLAPSAGDLQAYKIYLVRDKSKREDLAAASYDQYFIAEAPLALVFCADQKESETKYGERGVELYSTQDATIAAAYCQLAAAALGLGSAWVGGFDPLEVSRILNLGSYELPVAIIPIGFPAKQPERTSRKPISDLVNEV